MSCLLQYSPLKSFICQSSWWSTWVTITSVNRILSMQRNVPVCSYSSTGNFGRLIEAGITAL